MILPLLGRGEYLKAASCRLRKSGLWLARAADWSL